MTLKQVFTPLAILVVAVLTFLFVQTKWEAHTAAAVAVNEAKLASAESSAVIARKDAAGALALKSHADSIAGQYKRAAEGFLLRAHTAEQMYANARSRFDTVVVTAPDTCKPVIAQARIALASADSVAVTLHRVITVEHARGDSLSVALDTSSAVLRRLLTADVAVGRAATAIVNAAHPSLFARLFSNIVPKIGVGVGAGVDIHGKANAVVGATIGWVF